MSNRLDEAQKSAAAAQKLAKELNTLLSELDQYELRTATALWVEKTFPLRRSFLDATKTYFGGAAFPIDFRQNYQTARSQINGWVEKQTGNRINDLLSSDALTSDTRLIITSAIYFKGEWEKPFETSLTKTEDFWRAGDKQQTPMMHQYTAAKYAAFQADGSLFNTPVRIPVGTAPADPSLYPAAQRIYDTRAAVQGRKVGSRLDRAAVGRRVG